MFRNRLKELIGCTVLDMNYDDSLADAYRSVLCHRYQLYHAEIQAESSLV